MAIEVVVGQAPSSDTTQDLTVTDFGTAQAAIIYCTLGTTLGTAADDTVVSAGLYDGTRQRVMYASSEDFQATSDCRSGNRDDAVVYIVDAGTDTVIRSATATFITDGIQLTWAGGNTNQFQVMAILINNVTNAYVGHIIGNATSGQDASTTDPGFTPTTLICPGFGRSTAVDQGNNNSIFSIGFAHDDGGITQRAVGWYDSDGETTTVSGNETHNARIAESVNGVSGRASLELSTFDANGFTVTTRDSSNAVLVAYLALDMTDWDVDVGSVDSPNSTSVDWDVTGVGFQPDSVLIGCNFATSENVANSSDSVGMGLAAIVATPNDEACWSIATDDDVSSVSDTHSMMSTTEFEIMQAGGANAWRMSNLTFEADGWTIANADINQVNTTVRKWAHIAFKAPAGGESVPLVSPQPQRNRRASGRFL